MLIDVWFFAVCLFTAFWCGMGCCSAGFLLAARTNAQEGTATTGPNDIEPDAPRGGDVATTDGEGESADEDGGDTVVAI